MRPRVIFVLFLPDGEDLLQPMTDEEPKLTVTVSLPSSVQSLSRGKGDKLWHMVHLQLPHRHHHAGPHLAVAALPLPRLQVSTCTWGFLLTSLFRWWSHPGVWLLRPVACLLTFISYHCGHMIILPSVCWCRSVASWLMLMLLLLRFQLQRDMFPE